jgi:thioredoxin reductase
VILAIGRRGTPRKLDVPGEDRTKVVYRLIDAAEYRGRKVMVVGGGDSALEAAIALAGEPGTTVTLAYRRNTFDRARKSTRERLMALAADGKIDLRLGAAIGEIGEHGVVIVIDGETHSIANDDVIICAGGVLPNRLLEEAGVAVERKFGTA